MVDTILQVGKLGPWSCWTPPTLASYTFAQPPESQRLHPRAAASNALWPYRQLGLPQNILRAFLGTASRAT